MDTPIKTKNTESNRKDLADKVVDKLLPEDPQEIDTDLLYELLHDLLMFYYERISDDKFQIEWDSFELNARSSVD